MVFRPERSVGSMSSVVPEPPTATPWPRARIVEAIASHGTAVVALSGGVDSSVVALLSHEALAERATAITLVGSAVAAVEIDRARAVADRIGIAHVLVPVDPLGVAGYRENPSNRCYFCRSTEAGALRAWGEPRSVRQYLDGAHLDDLGDLRPGLRAMDEAGVRHPLLEAGWGKSDVRALARSADLPNWDVPSDACLASRVVHGQPLTAALLGRVARSEAWLRTLGFRRVRVRVRGATARIEVDPGEVARLADPRTAPRVVTALRGFGFTDVEIDPSGYRPRAGA